MSINLCRHHYCKVTTFKLLWVAKFKPENSLIFSNNIHWHISSNWYNYFENISKRHWTWIVYFLCIFSFSILNKSNTIIANNKPSKHWIAIVASTTVAAFSSHIITDVNFFWRLETVLIYIVLAIGTLIHVPYRWFWINIIVLNHHPFCSCATFTSCIIWICLRNSLWLSKQIRLGLFCWIQIISQTFHLIFNIFVWYRSGSFWPTFQIWDSTGWFVRNFSLLHSVLSHCIHCINLLHHGKRIESWLNLLFLNVVLTHFYSIQNLFF